MQYKTRCIQSYGLKVKKKIYRSGLDKESEKEAIAPFAEVIEYEASLGWVLHSVVPFDKHIYRKRSFWEWLVGWIPFVGDFLCPHLKEEVFRGKNCTLYFLTFVSGD